MSIEAENRATQYIESILNMRFSYSLNLPGKWGTVDRCLYLNDEKIILLEIEAKQKHPCTNVIKLWPFLDENPTISCILLQIFFEDSPGRSSNRGRLSIWVANKMKEELGLRFKYFRVVISSNNSIIEGAEELSKFAAAIKRIK